MKTNPWRRTGRWVGLIVAAWVSIVASNPSGAATQVRVDGGILRMRNLWAAMDTQEYWGISIDYGGDTWPVDVAFGLHVFHGEATESSFVVDGILFCIPLFVCIPTGHTVERTLARSSMQEVSAGLQKSWGGPSSALHGHIGGGASYVEVSLRSVEEGFEREDGSPGLWARAGFFAGLPRGANVQFTLGFELRALGATRLRLGGGSADADYLQGNVSAGLVW